MLPERCPWPDPKLVEYFGAQPPARRRSTSHPVRRRRCLHSSAGAPASCRRHGRSLPPRSLQPRSQPLAFHLSSAPRPRRATHAGGLGAREKPSEDPNNDGDDCRGGRYYRGDFRCPLLGSGNLSFLLKPFIRKISVFNVKPGGSKDAQADLLFPHLFELGSLLAFIGHAGAPSARRRSP
jgi:hypothetical protein